MKSTAYALATILVLFLVAPVLAHGTGGTHDAEVYFRPESPVVAEPVTIDIIVKDSAGAPALALDVVDGSVMNVFIISSDLTTVRQLRPEDISDGLSFQWIGAYSVRTTLPKAGNYLLVSEYTLSGEKHQIVYSFNLSGEPLATPSTDSAKTREIGMHTVTVQPRSAIYANEPTDITVYLERNGVPDLNLRAHYGTALHVLGARADLTNPISARSTQLQGGPTVSAQVVFPTSGVYTVFTQVNATGEILTTQYLVTVQEARETQSSPIIIVFIVAVLILVAAVVVARKQRRK